MIRYFVCKECKRTSAGEYTGNKQVLCGALIGFIIKDGKETPCGCGGILEEITKDEATELAYASRR